MKIHMVYIKSPDRPEPMMGILIYDLRGENGEWTIPYMESYVIRGQVKIDAIIKILGVSKSKLPFVSRFGIPVTTDQVELLEVITSEEDEHQGILYVLNEFVKGKIDYQTLKEKMAPYIIARNLKQ